MGPHQQKSAFVAYFLWFVGGFGVLGLHHFYLGDDRKTFLWLSSFGGFGLGSLRDLFFIPRYCKARVDDLERRKSFPLLGGTFAFCYFFSRVSTLAFCNRYLLDPTSPWIAVAIRALSSAVIAHLCIGSGNRKSNTTSILRIAVVSALMQIIILMLPAMNEIRLATFIPGVQTVAAFSSAAFAYRFRSFQSYWNRSQSFVLVRMIRIFLGVVVVFGLIAMAIYLNARIPITVQEGDDVKKSYVYLADVDWSNDMSVEKFLEYLFKFLLEFEEVRKFVSEDEIDEAAAYAELGLKVQKKKNYCAFPQL